MKKLICAILVSIILVSALGILAFAFDPGTPNSILYFDPTISYSNVRDSAFYMYYGPYAWSEYCWSSTKISIADDQGARAYAWVKSGNKTNYEVTTDEDNGYVETPGAFIDEPVADYTQHYGIRYENDGTNPVWNIGYRSINTISK